MYLKIENDIIEYPIWDIRAEFPEVSLPEVLTKDNLPEGFYLVNITERPSSWDKTYVEGTPVLNSNNEYEQSWVGTILLSEELETKKESIRKSIINQVQARLDNFAKEKGYDSILSACSYKDSTNTIFANEAQIAILARDNTWTALYQVQLDVDNNLIPMPLSIDDIELPELKW